MRGIGIGIGLGFSKRKKRKLSDDLAAKFLFLWTGKYDEGGIANDLGTDIITVVDKDWTTKHIPADSTAKFTLPATQAYTDADTDGFWTDGECDVTRLVSYDPERTFVQYSDHPPHDIQKIGVLKADAVLTEADENELSRYFRLPWWRFGYFNYYGWWKANMLADEVREWEAPE